MCMCVNVNVNACDFVCVQLFVNNEYFSWFKHFENDKYAILFEGLETMCDCFICIVLYCFLSNKLKRMSNNRNL